MPETSCSIDDADRKILDIIQTAFPVVHRPYAVIGQLVGLTEDEVFKRVGRMRKNGIVRRLGANFQSARLGFVSTLCAAKVPESKIDLFVARVNAEKGVTHNYERDHDWNIWFTLIAPSFEEAASILDSISGDTGIEILNLPATQLFKIRVDFPMEKNTAHAS